MRQDTLLSSGGLASPPFPHLPLPFPPARDLLSQVYAYARLWGVAGTVHWNHAQPEHVVVSDGWHPLHPPPIHIGPLPPARLGEEGGEDKKKGGTPGRGGPCKRGRKQGGAP
eukprot:scaffold9851_cov100-Isochrysis_galbana.AAC.5